MLRPTPTHRTLIGLALAAIMAVTRGHHFASVDDMLPGASWAAFFLAGVYLRSPWMLAALFGEAALLDYAAVTWGGVSSFCVSPAYVALLPAYGTLWFGGRWYAKHHRFTPATLIPLAGSVLVSAAACELISSGSFYLFSGRFPEPTLAVFIGSLVGYFPPNLANLAFWVGAGSLVHAFASRSRGDASALSS